MNTGAHPDDEQSHLLAYYSRGLGVRTISVIASRGEGGQNAVGTEYGPALGVVRTRELEEASRITGVTLRILSQDYQDPIYDFGFSKTPEETIEKWGSEVVLERLVRVIREERPDVVMPSFRDEWGQHGHHRAMTRLTLEAVKLSADPAAFPEHLAEGLKPWQVRKVYLPANPSRESGGVYLSTDPGKPTIAIEVGHFDPDLGVSYVQLGEESRFLHKSQGMGRELPPGPRTAYAELVYSSVSTAEPERSMFDGLPYTVADLAGVLPAGFEEIAAGLERLQSGIDAIHAAFPRRALVLQAAHRTLAEVRDLMAAVQASDLPEPIKADVTFRIQVKERQLEHVSAVAALLVPGLRAKDYEVVRGQAVELELFAFNGGQVPLRVVRLELRVPEGWRVETLEIPQQSALEYNQTVKARFRVTVPKEAPLFHPYRSLGLQGVVRYEVDGVPAAVPVALARPLAVLPDFSVTADPAALLLNTRSPEKPLSVSVLLRNYRPQAARVAAQLEVPDGWGVEPQQREVQLSASGGVEAVSFTVRPPRTVQAGTYSIRVVAKGEGTVCSESVRVIEHGHIGRTYMVTPSTLKATAFPLATAPVKIGYVASGVDSVPQFLEQMGFPVTLLDREAVLSGDLSQYDTIVLGVYAYRFRPELLAANDRLLSYVKGGGHLIVQLHRPGDNWSADRLPPYRLVIGQPSFNWRVTDEAAPVTVLQPDHPIFNWPNAIGSDDWDGWVKDRGLYFPMEWAPEYTPLVAMGDPGWEPMKGGMLLARYGEGTYLYTSLTWHYQLEQHVPGAYRMMANMVSLPAYRRQGNKPDSGT